MRNIYKLRCSTPLKINQMLFQKTAEIKVFYLTAIYYYETCVNNIKTDTGKRKEEEKMVYSKEVTT